jgi:peptidoglycan-N-acetylglucosamine deacetylase
MGPGRTLGLRGLQAALASALVAVPLAIPVTVHDLPPPIAVRVDASTRYVPPGTTYGQVIGDFGLHATDGRLLSVSGRVLRHGAYPGRIELNGRRAARSTTLAEGDAVRVVNGTDHTEAIATTSEAVSGGEVADPEFTLGTTPGNQIVHRGELSGELVSTEFEPTGPTEVPNAVALTFDDGPSTLYTEKVLHVLGRFGVRATFFVIGEQADQHPELVQEELAAGMAVGNHTWDHPDSPPFRDLPRPRMVEEMRRTSESLQGNVALTPVVFRPPGGAYSDLVVQVAREQGMRVVLWSVDPEDWRSAARARDIARTVLDNVHAGSIVLMHDGGGFQDATVKALPRIIKGIQKRGLDFVTLSA